MIELTLFASTFVAVFALGFQSQNVIGGHYLAAFLTSFAIGGAHLFLYKLVPDAGQLQIAAYLAGGPFGITAAMWAHRRTLGRRPAITKRRWTQVAGRPMQAGDDID